MTSEPTGRVYFKPELLGLAEISTLKDKAIDVVAMTGESTPVYTDGDSLRGSVSTYVDVCTNV